MPQVGLRHRPRRRGSAKSPEMSGPDGAPVPLGRRYASGRWPSPPRHCGHPVADGGTALRTGVQMWDCLRCCMSFTGVGPPLQAQVERDPSRGWGVGRATSALTTATTEDLGPLSLRGHPTHA